MPHKDNNKSLKSNNSGKIFLIPDEVIDQVKELNIVDALSPYITVKRSGSAYEAICPFHQDHNPSLKINPAKQLYKCFSCGKSGKNAIDVVMKVKSVEWYDAVRLIARDHQISIPEIEMSEEEETDYKNRAAIYNVNRWAADWFRKQLHSKENSKALEYLKSRWDDEDTIDHFSLGYAPNGWYNLLNAAKKEGYKEELLLGAGLINKNDETGNTCDFFSDRIIFPISDRRGIAGFTGRHVPWNETKHKYLNTKTTLVYQKSEFPYNFYQAIRFIKEKENAYLVEGNADVVGLHQIDIYNSFALSGTSLTPGYIEQLKKITSCITLIGDTDKPGQDSVSRSAKMIIESGMYCKIIPLPDGTEKQDADSFFKDKATFDEYDIAPHKKDYILYFAEKEKQKQKNGHKEPDQEAKLLKTMAGLIHRLPQLSHNGYVDGITKILDLNKKDLKDSIKALLKEPIVAKPKTIIPEGVDEDTALSSGFYEKNNCYCFISKEGVFKASNFTIKPLFHIYSKSDNKRLIEITNEHGHARILDIPSKMFTVDQFQQAVFGEGNFIFFGSKSHFMKVLERISNNFPFCNELKTLGWQREGFYAFSNGILDGSFIPVDKFGITEFKGSKYFSPAFSVVYSDVREDDDEYSNDREFIWQQSPVTFGEWSKLMLEVYGEKAMPAMAYIIAAVFRDLIFDKYKLFPHLFLFGETQSGKSQFAYSLSNFFFNSMPPFSLNSGTQVGFFRRLSRVKNALVWFDEYNNNIDEKRFQSLKAAYDGMGHEKGKMTNDNRTSITRVNSATVISGQYLPTLDDNALFSRSILISFEKQKYTPEQMKAFSTLKGFETEGLSSLVNDIINYRDRVESEYTMAYSDLLDKMKDDLTREGKAFEERLVRNFVSVLTPVKIILETDKPLELNFTFDQLYAYSKEKISELSAQITSSEALANFWQMVEFLLDDHKIEEGVDFKICSGIEITYKNKNETWISEEIDIRKNALLIRFTKIHPLYMEAHRKQFGKNGVDITSLTYYIKHQPAYKGFVSSVRFSNSVTSCFYFDYDQLKINLTRSMVNNSNEDTQNNITDDSDKNLPF